MLPGITREEWERMSPTEQANWYLANVYRNEPQLTLRAILIGIVFGAGFGSINIYVGSRTGWTIGTGIVTAVAAFAVFRLLGTLKLSKRFYISENITVQSIAVMAGYTTAPLFSPMAAYTLFYRKMIPLWQAIPWIATSFMLGIFIAFFLKRMYVNANPWRYPFPEGIGSGIMTKQIHEQNQKGNVIVLLVSTIASALFMLFKSGKVLAHIDPRLVRFKIVEYLDEVVFKLLKIAPTINGFRLEQLAIRCETEIVLGATGMLMSLRSGGSMMLGALINYCIIAPLLMQHGIIAKSGGFRAIVGWSVWLGGSIMFGAALVSFFGSVLTRKNVRAIIENLKRRDEKATDPLASIEVPAWISLPGILVTGILLSVLTWKFFGTPLWINFLTIALVLPLSILAVHATAETGTTPGSTTSKITQLSLSFVQPGQAVQNLMAAGIVTEASLGAAQLCSDLRTCHMLGGNPRKQIILHFLGIMVGVCTLTPLWYYLVGGNIDLIGSDQFPVPSAKTWKAVSEALAGGFNTLHYSARTALVVGLIIGIVLELVCLSRQKAQRAWDNEKATRDAGLARDKTVPLNKRPWGLPLSTVSFGFGFVLQFTNSFAMFIGSFIGTALRYYFEHRYTKDLAESKDRQVQIVAGGIMAGGSIVGLITAIMK